MKKKNRKEDQLLRNLADDYAKRYNLPLQTKEEEGAEFRVRIARTLAQMGYSIQAQEVLYNKCDDPRNALFKSLDGGYGDAYLLEVAQEVEAFLTQANQRATRIRRRWVFW